MSHVGSTVHVTMSCQICGVMSDAHQCHFGCILDRIIQENSTWCWSDNRSVDVFSADLPQVIVLERSTLHPPGDRARTLHPPNLLVERRVLPFRGRGEQLVARIQSTQELPVLGGYIAAVSAARVRRCVDGHHLDYANSFSVICTVWE